MTAPRLVRDPLPDCLYCGGSGWHHHAVCFCRMMTDTPPDAEEVRRQDEEKGRHDDG